MNFFLPFVLTIVLLAIWTDVASAKPRKAEVASWYGEELRGRLTANGEKFDPDALTCASWDYPFGTKLRVSHGGKSVIVRVNDRGPSKQFLVRTIDLSREAFRRLAPLEEGLIGVTITPVK